VAASPQRIISTEMLRYHGLLLSFFFNSPALRLVGATNAEAETTRMAKMRTIRRIMVAAGNQNVMPVIAKDTHSKLHLDTP
jgi:hypothetical protein